MVSNCANPECGKPLHYLRDGKIFQLQFRSAENQNAKRMEHFWLCGVCSAKYDVRQAAAGVEVVPLGRARMPQRMLIDAA